MNTTIRILTVAAVEILKCAGDPIYFIENYYYVDHPIHGRQLLKLNQQQKDAVVGLSHGLNTVILASRQVGKSTVVGAYLAWNALFKQNQNIFITSRTLAMSMDTLDKIRFAYNNLPDFLKPALLYNTKTLLQFDNGTRIHATPATEKLGRSTTISHLFVDEMAYIPDSCKDQIRFYLLPQLTKDSQFIAASTPHGTELFYRLWQSAYYGQSDMLAIKMLASEDPTKGEEYLNDMRAMLGERLFREEYLCEFISH